MRSGRAGVTAAAGRASSDAKGLGAGDAAGAAVAPAAVAGAQPGSAPSSLATLAATVPKHLQDVQKLVPATSREHFVGRLPGGYM